MLYYGVSYYPEQRSREQWITDLELMKEAGMNTIRATEFSWSRMEPEEGIYDFDWLESFVELAGEYGISLVLGCPVRTVPTWFVSLYPDVMSVSQDGSRMSYGTRYSYCINHPMLREKAVALTAEMARRFGGNHNIAGWHLDNEYGAELDCHCQYCKSAFRTYLREKYPTIENLNEQWGNVFWSLEYKNFDQIDTPYILPQKSCYNPAHYMNWREFISESSISILNQQIHSIRLFSLPDKFISTNVQPIHNQRTDYYRMCSDLDIAGTNYYPSFGDNYRDISMGLPLVRGYRNGQNFLMWELRCGAHIRPLSDSPMPGEAERLAAHCIANGANGIVYFRWIAYPYGAEQIHGAIVSLAGKPLWQFGEYKKIGSILKRISAEIEKTVIKSDVAILFDFRNRWITTGYTVWERQPELFYTEYCKMLYKTIRDKGFNSDLIGRYQDLSKYKMVIVPQLQSIDDDLAEKLCGYVQNGGSLMLHPLCCQKNEHARIYDQRLHPRIAELYGISIDSPNPIPETGNVGIEYNGENYRAVVFADIVEPEQGMTGEGKLTGVWFDSPAVLERKRGDGRAIYMCCYAEADFYAAYLPDLFERTGVHPVRHVAAGPDFEVCERTDGINNYVFVLNGLGVPRSFKLEKDSYDIWNDCPVKAGEVTLNPAGVMVLRF